MKNVKRIISFILCLAIFSAMSISAFAAPAETASVMHVKDGTTITLRQHTDVIMRGIPSTSGAKVHTLYVGDTVEIIKWMYATVGDYDWASLRHFDTGRYIYGYSANSLLS